jgi:indolepyruvate ferredoxin oxidoreductase beta subunit
MQKMKYDMIIAGVGGQGVISISALIATGAMEEGFFVKQSEVHGMSQLGGAVYSHLRISNRPVFSNLIPMGRANLLLSMEPMEAFRYLDYLSGDGNIISSSVPVANINNYPNIDKVLEKIQSFPGSATINMAVLAKKAGSPKAASMILAGAASHYLPLKEKTMKNGISKMFGGKGEKIVDMNYKAFDLGRAAITPIRDQKKQSANLI